MRSNNVFIFSLLLSILLFLSNYAYAENQCIVVQMQNNTENNYKISAIEDLMREHGLLSRALLIYEKELQTINNGEKPNYAVIFQTATIIKNFIENYHEKLEENYIFPNFTNASKAGELTNLVNTLKKQHEYGRQLTADILKITAQKHQIIDKNENTKLANSIKAFITMYRPHKAREDTILFPALHKTLPPKEYDKLGDKFEDKENELFGADGFEKKLSIIADLEKQIGINDLNQFN